MQRLAVIALAALAVSVASCRTEEAEDEGTFRITTSSLARAMVGHVYNQSINTKSGPAGPYFWTVTTALPSGLELFGAGESAQLYGIPDAAGALSVTFQVQAPGGDSIQRTLELIVDPALEIRTAGVPAGTHNRPYEFQFVAAGGLVPRHWDIAEGSLPPGLSLADDGLLQGAPTNSGTYAFRTRVTDGAGRSRSWAYAMQVVGSSRSLQIADKLAPPLVIGRAFATRLHAYGGTGAGYNWSIQSGALPAGMTISAVGSNEAEIAGTPTGSGAFTVTIQVQDSGAGVGTLDLDLHVHDPGTIVAFAGGGSGSTGGVGDGGQADDAVLSDPRGLDRDSAGNVYIADTGHNRIRRVDAATGVITTVAGNGADGYAGDGGQAVQAEIWLPHDVAVDSANGVLYIADYGNNRIRAVNLSTGEISTVAGGGSMGLNEGGQAVDAALDNPEGLGLDAFGNVYVAVRWNQYGNRIRRIDRTTGLITTVAGTGVEGDSGDYGQATSAQIGQPRDVAVDSVGNIYIADSLNNRVRVVNATTGIITPFAGTGVQGNAGDGGQASGALLSNVGALAFDGSDNLYIADTYNNRVRRVDGTTGIITTVAGSGTPGATGGGPAGDGGQANQATLDRPSGVGFDLAGNLLIGDTNNLRVRSVDNSGVISTWAGGGISVPGPASPTAALFNEPHAACVDAVGNTYIADPYGCFIYRISAYTGFIETFAGTGTAGSTGDGGPATAATLDGPISVAADADGNIYIAEFNGHRVRRVDALTGNILTLAGSGVPGYLGDGGPAATARLDTPLAVVWHPDNSVLIVDNANYRLRRVHLSTGLISTVAGTGTLALPTSGALAVSSSVTNLYHVEVAVNGDLYIGDNVAQVWQLRFTSGLIHEVPGAVPPAFNTLGGIIPLVGDQLYVADSIGSRVYLLSAAGALTPVAGTGTQGNSGDGADALSADLLAVNGLAISPGGDLLIVSGTRVRVVLAP